jgi:hypothetical protein
MTILPAVLPRLAGFWLWVYRLVFAAVTAIAIFAAGATTWLDGRNTSLTTPQVWGGALYGLGVRTFSPTPGKGWRIIRPFSTEAIASGMSPGDGIVAINGQRLTEHAGIPPFAQIIDAREGAKATFTLRGADDVVRDYVLTWHARNIAAWYRGSCLDPWRQSMGRRLIYDLMTLLLLLPATILFLRRPREIVAAAFAISLALLSIEPTGEFWAAIGMVNTYRILSAAPYILILMIGCAFSDGRFWPAWTRFSLILVPLLYAPLILTVDGYGNFAMLTAPAFLVLITLLIMRYRELPVGGERQQFRWVAFSLAVGVLTFLSRIPLVTVQEHLSPAPYSPWVDLSASFVHALGYAIIGGGFAIALLRYRLYDAESVISRSVAVTATTLLLAGIWAASEKAIEVTLALQLDIHEEAIASAIGAGIAVIVVTPLHGRVHEWMDKRFRKGVWRLREKLPAMAAALSQRVGTRALCDTMLDHVARAVNVKRAALVINRNGRSVVITYIGPPLGNSRGGVARQTLPKTGGAVDEESDFVFRLALSEEGSPAAAWLMLGPRPDGSPCNRDERNALEELAGPLASAIATTEARDKRDHLLSKLEKRLSAIEARIQV